MTIEPAGMTDMEAVRRTLQAHGPSPLGSATFVRVRKVGGLGLGPICAAVLAPCSIRLDPQWKGSLGLCSGWGKPAKANVSFVTADGYL